MENQRIRLSKSMLKSGLLRLLKDKDLNQISIIELCNEAQINRTTFYKYYGSQLDLLYEIEQDFLEELNSDLEDVLKDNINAMLSILNHLYEQREVFCVLVRSIPSSDFSKHLFSIPSIRAIFQNMESESGYTELQAQYVRQFIFQGTFSILYDWLSSESPEPAPIIAEILGLLKNKF